MILSPAESFFFITSLYFLTRVFASDFLALAFAFAFFFATFFDPPTIPPYTPSVFITRCGPIPQSTNTLFVSF